MGNDFEVLASALALVAGRKSVQELANPTFDIQDDGDIATAFSVACIALRINEATCLHVPADVETPEKYEGFTWKLFPFASLYPSKCAIQSMVQEGIGLYLELWSDGAAMRRGARICADLLSSGAFGSSQKECWTTFRDRLAQEWCEGDVSLATRFLAVCEEE